VDDAQIGGFSISALRGTTTGGIMAYQIVKSVAVPSDVRLVNLHGKKAQISLNGRTQHVMETGTPGRLSMFMLTTFRNIRGEEFGFDSTEIERAIFRS
jgi:hypothetical protein